MLHLRIAVFSLLFAFCLPAQTADGLASPPCQRLPKWWLDEGVVIAGSWESPTFRMRRATEDTRESILDGWRHEHSDAFVQQLKEFGFNFVMVPIYKGFGLKAERATMQEIKRFTEVCHRLGIRVGVYAFSGTIGYESVFAENPGAREWLVWDRDGKSIPYGAQYYRRWVNRSHPEVRAHLKEVVRYAVQEAKVDLIHLDNYHVAPGYEPYSVTQFRSYLKNKYSPDQLLGRFGVGQVDAFEPPPMEPGYSSADQLLQDFLNYRADTLADTYRELGEYARSLNPDVVMEANPGGYYGNVGPRGLGTITVDHTRLLQWGGAFWDEGRRSGMSKGVLFSRFRSMKMGRQFNNAVFFYTADKVSMAESLANNLQSAGCPVWFEGGKLTSSHYLYKNKPVPPEIPTYIRFFKTEQQYYRDAKEIADVGVLHTFANDTYSPPVTRSRRAAFEQALYQGKVPFTLVPGNYPGDLTRFRVLVLADLALWPENLTAPIRDYVERGGGLVVTGETGSFDANHHRRAERALADLFDVSLGATVVRAKRGKGRVIYIPSVAMPKIIRPKTALGSSREPADGDIATLPLNRTALLEAVRWAAGTPLQVEVNAPESVTMGLFEQATGRRVLHLVNYNEQMPVSGIPVTLQVASGKRMSSVTLLSPDLGPKQALAYKQSGHAVQFIVPKLQTYALIAVE